MRMPSGLRDLHIIFCIITVTTPVMRDPRDFSDLHVIFASSCYHPCHEVVQKLHGVLKQWKIKLVCENVCWVESVLQGACVSLLLFTDLWLSGKAGHLVHFRVTLVLHNQLTWVGLVPSIESILQPNNPSWHGAFTSWLWTRRGWG